MSQITLTLDLNSENLEILGVLANLLQKPSKPTAPAEQLRLFDVIAATPQVEAPAPAAPATPEPAPAPEASNAVATAVKADASTAITITAIRSVASVLAKTSRQSALREIFSRYGAVKLSDIPQDSYPALMADLEAAANG